MTTFPGALLTTNNHANLWPDDSPHTRIGRLAKLNDNDLVLVIAVGSQYYYVISCAGVGYVSVGFMHSSTATQ